MHYTAQVQTAVEVLDHFDPTKGPLAPHIKRTLKPLGFVGSKDRRSITDLVYAVIRKAPLLFKCLNPSQDNHPWELNKGRQLMLAYTTLEGSDIEAVFKGDEHGPSPLTESEKENLAEIHDVFKDLKDTDIAKTCLPKWLFSILKQSCVLPDLVTLNQEAPVDIRCTFDPKKLRKKFRDEGIEATATPYAKKCLRLKTNQNLQNHSLFEMGHFDIQDESSQILAALCDPKPGMRILDLCSGAGGKALALANICPTAYITATDISKKRLEIAKKRVKDQKITNIKFIPYEGLHAQQHQGTYDLVLVDAPCSGSGTLRRHPELKCLLTPIMIDDYHDIQRGILHKAAAYVKPAGHLMYATCSLIPKENEAHIPPFKVKHPDFSLVNLRPFCDKLLNKNPFDVPHESETSSARNFLYLRTGQHETDGFFTALFQKDPL